jgi:hypothetical protein
VTPTMISTRLNPAVRLLNTGFEVGLMTVSSCYPLMRVTAT